MNQERYLVKSNGDNIVGTEVGFAKLFDLLKNHKSAVIVVPFIGAAKDTMLVKVLGDKLSKKLIKKRVLTLDDDKTISLCAHSALKNYSHADLYLALWGTEQLIMDIEKLSQWRANILVTWMPKDSEKWVAQYPVQIIYDDDKGEQGIQYP